MQVDNEGYTQFVNARVPNDALRVTLNDGTSVIRGIVSASQVDADNEQITVDSGWPGGGILLSDISRVDFVQKVRMASDKVSMTHHNNNGQSTIKFPVITVFE